MHTVDCTDSCTDKCWRHQRTYRCANIRVRNLVLEQLRNVFDILRRYCVLWQLLRVGGVSLCVLPRVQLVHTHRSSHFCPKQRWRHECTYRRANSALHVDL